jgi:carboxymethylenebutenolidase
MTTSPTATTTELTASDGFKLAAYVSQPAAAPRGAIVVIQEIFGVNAHVRAVCDGFAADGYLAIAPALFDRQTKGVELGYAEQDIAKGRDFKAGANTDAALLDLAAARDHVREAGRVGVVGYCWGGYLAWLAACRLDGLAAAVVYYGGGIGDVLAEIPRCPVLGHFGERDAMIPMAVIDDWRARHPQHPVHTYDAGHGFNCDHRGSHDAGAAATARERTLAFFRQHVG